VRLCKLKACRFFANHVVCKCLFEAWRLTLLTIKFRFLLHGDYVKNHLKYFYSSFAMVVIALNTKQLLRKKTRLYLLLIIKKLKNNLNFLILAFFLMEIVLIFICAYRCHFYLLPRAPNSWTLVERATHFVCDFWKAFDFVFFSRQKHIFMHTNV